jgi:hypothetical protein
MCDISLPNEFERGALAIALTMSLTVLWKSHDDKRIWTVWKHVENFTIRTVGTCTKQQQDTTQSHDCATHKKRLHTIAIAFYLCSAIVVYQTLSLLQIVVELL